MKMDRLKPPSEFSFEDGNKSNAWKSWKKSLQFFLVATKINEESNAVKTSTLLTCIGKKGIDIYDTFTFNTEEDKLKLDVVLQKFDTYCEPRKNTTMMRYKFLTHKQSMGQSFGDFVIELKKLSEDCEFGDLKNSLVKDVIICGINDNNLRERLLRIDEADSNLEKIYKNWPSSGTNKSACQTTPSGREISSRSEA